MKNIILVVVIFIIFVGSLFSQPIIGGRLGLNMANISQKDIKDNGARIGLHIGGMMQFPLEQNILIQPELLYSMKGMKQDKPDGTTWAMDYLEFPVIVKYDYVIPNLRVQPYIGPSFGLLLSAKTKWERNFEWVTADFKDYTNDLDVGLNIGADVVFMKNILPDLPILMLGMRYNIGLTNASKDPLPDFYNRTFMINLGFLFGLE